MANQMISNEQADSAIDAARQAFGADTGKMIERSEAMADALGVLRQWMTPSRLAKFKSLAGTTLGFRTDRDGREPYPDAVLSDCAIEAAILGLEWVGNHFNIIGGRCYVTQAGMWWLIGRRSPGITNVRLSIGVPRMAQGGAVVKCRCEWKKGGVDDFVEDEIPVKVNEKMGVDAIIGKATRKILARAHRQMHGSITVADGEIDDTKTADDAARAAEVATRVADGAASRTEPNPDAPVADSIFVQDVSKFIDEPKGGGK